MPHLNSPLPALSTSSDSHSGQVVPSFGGVLEEITFATVFSEDFGPLLPLNCPLERRWRDLAWLPCFSLLTIRCKCGSGMLSPARTTGWDLYLHNLMWRSTALPIGADIQM